MKKTVVIVVGLVFSIIALYSMYFFYGMYIPFLHQGDIVTRATVRDDRIWYVTKDGEYQELTIKGVNLDASLPGYNSSDYMVDYETWIQWFTHIQVMGANTIRIYTVYNDDFYRAFYDYNKKKDHPLLLIQGIQVMDYPGNNRNDAFDDEFFDNLITDATTAVDVIHGRRNIPLGIRTGAGIYRYDISDWVLGYIVGNEWNASTVEYTNHRNYDPSYNGKYFETTEEANAFEGLLAAVMDHMISYDIDKYRESRLITFANEPLSDPFTYEKFYGMQIGKFAEIDAEHIRTVNSDYTGYYASYALLPFCDNYKEYFSEEQKKELKGILNELNSDKYLGDYARLLAKYHSIPVVISSMECSSARGVVDHPKNYTEREQGEELVRIYKDVTQAGCKGGFLAAWQDAWPRKSWNTSYALETYNNEYWQDVQTVAQNRGILAFDSGEDAVCIVDGETDDWDNVPVFSKDAQYTMKVNQDAKYIYILIQGENLRKPEELYIAFDITPKSGSYVVDGTKTKFEHKIDFLLKVHGTMETKLLVQERYDSLRQNYLERITGEDPFVKEPAVDTTVFNPVRMIMANRNVAEPWMSDEEMEQLSYFDTFETGRLRHGNTDPLSPYYDSLADFNLEKSTLELRIPWQMLNFSDPSQKKIHDDYYLNYGCDSLVVDQIYLGVGDSTYDVVQLEEIPLKEWEDIIVRQRLKQSYGIIRNYWKEQ